MGFEAQDPKEPPLDSKSESESLSIMSNSLRPHELYSPWNSPGQNTGVGRRSLLQGIFPTQGWDPGPSKRSNIAFKFCFPVLHYHSLRIFSDFSKAD